MNTAGPLRGVSLFAPLFPWAATHGYSRPGPAGRNALAAACCKPRRDAPSGRVFRISPLRMTSRDVPCGASAARHTCPVRFVLDLLWIALDLRLFKRPSAPFEKGDGARNERRGMGDGTALEGRRAEGGGRRAEATSQLLNISTPKLSCQQPRAKS
jgi:hypothetical protein